MTPHSNLSDAQKHEKVIREIRLRFGLDKPAEPSFVKRFWLKLKGMFAP